MTARRRELEPAHLRHLLEQMQPGTCRRKHSNAGRNGRGLFRLWTENGRGATSSANTPTAFLTRSRRNARERGTRRTVRAAAARKGLSFGSDDLVLQERQHAATHGRDQGATLTRTPWAACLVLLVAVAHVLGGAVLLRQLGAPGWAVAAWLMLNVRVRIGQPRPSTRQASLRFSERKRRS
jgi:hypothetical protein